MKAGEFKDRTKKFAVSVMKLVGALPKTVAGRAVASPLIRCGTAVGATYRSTCKSRNHFDFMARIGVVEEATDESCYWFELILESGMLEAAQVQPLLDEGRELKRIFSKSRKAAVRRFKERTERPRTGEDGGWSNDEDIPF
jgi:four helix bundle protein